MIETRAKVAMIAALMFGLTGTAYAESLATAAAKIHASFFREVIFIDGSSNDVSAKVYLPDGSLIHIDNANWIQIANTVCDSMNMKPTEARLIYCVTK